MVVVTGGVGKLAGTILAAAGIGGLNKIIEPALGAVFGKVAILVARHPVHPAAAVRALRDQGALCGSVSAGVPRRGARSSLVVGLPVLNMLPPGSPLHVSDFTLNLFGKFLTYAILALGIDLHLGLCRRARPGPRRVLRPRRLRDGHAPDAGDRHPERLPERAAGLHGVEPGEGAAAVLEAVLQRAVHRCSRSWLVPGAVRAASSAS